MLTNGKLQLEKIFRGETPDFPPTFELVFYLHKEMFGMDYDEAMAHAHTDAARIDASEAFHREVALRCVDEFGYAAVTMPHYGATFDLFPAIKKLKRELDGRALIMGKNGDSVIWMPVGGDAYYEFALDLYEAPEKLHALAKQKVATAKEYTLRQIDAGVDFIMQNTDFGLNTGPFISPAQFAEFCAPYMAEIIAYQHEQGLPVIMHSDGNLNSILDQIHATGVDGYQSIDPQGMMDIAEVRRLYPDWILMGNVNCAMLQEVQEEQIRESVRYCMTHGGMGKRYIFSTSNCIYPSMPPESYHIMLDEYERCVQLRVKS